MQITGLNFKLDVGLYRLDRQVACQRYRQNPLTATVKAQLLASFGNFNMTMPKITAALATA
jgi:hypothetical protein